MDTQKKAVITGICGQDGPYLAALLLSKGYEVHGVTRQSTHTDIANLEYLGISREIVIHHIDICDIGAITDLIATEKPQEFYNLAAQSFVGSSWQLANVTSDINGTAVCSMLQAILRHTPETRFYQASTSELFGNSSQSIQNEDTPLHPESPYAAAKLYAYWMTRIYRESFGLHASNGILFNHESPIRGENFVTRKITKGISQIVAGKQDFLELGNLESRRDWGFAGDFVEAMWLMTQNQHPDDYVVATGRTHSIRDFLDVAFRYVGIEDWSPFVKINPEYFRPSDVNFLLGDASKAKKQLNWKPRVDLHNLVQMMMENDLARAGVNMHPKLKRVV